MENNLKPEDMEPECCKVQIKEEVFFELIEEQDCIDEIEEESGVINIIKEEKGYLDEKHDQSFTSHILKEENILINQIKKEDLNTIDVNKDEEFIKEEEEFDYIWPEWTLKETDPLALPEIKCENEFPNTKEASVSLCESSSRKDFAIPSCSTPGITSRPNQLTESSSSVTEPICFKQNSTDFAIPSCSTPGIISRPYQLTESSSPVTEPICIIQNSTGSHQIWNQDESGSMEKEKNKHKKRNDRRHFCIYCEAVVTNFKRHVIRKHSDQTPVQQYLSINDKDIQSSIRKRKLLEEIRLQGNHLNNKLVVSTRSTVETSLSLLPTRRPRVGSQKTPLDYTSCKKCFGLFSKRTFYRHAHKCIQETEEQSSDNEKELNEGEMLKSVSKFSYIKSYGDFLNPNPSISSETWETEIFQTIQKDDIGKVACCDPLIVCVANDFLSNHRAIHNKYNVTKKMRDAGRLLLKVREKDSCVKNFSDCFSPDKIDTVMTAVQELCGCHPTTGEVGVIGMPARLSWVIQESAEKLLDDALTSRKICTRTPDVVRSEVKDFLQIFRRRWKYVVSTNAEKCRKRLRMTKPVVMPDLGGIKLLHKEIKEL